MKETKTLAELLRGSDIDQVIAKGIIKILLNYSPGSRDYEGAKRQFNRLRDDSPLKRLIMDELAKHGFRFRPPRKGEKYQCLKLDDGKVRQDG